MLVTRRSFLSVMTAAGGACLLPRWARAVDYALDGQLPIEISSPGRYVLNSNQLVNLERTPAILVTADGVEIDLQGFTIENSYGAATVSMGVAAKDHSNIWIHDGTLKGFYAGVFFRDTLGGSRGHRVENCTVTDSTAAGLMMSGNGCVIAENTITNTGGSLLYSPPSACTAGIGIAVLYSLGCLIKANNISIQDSGSAQGSVGICVNSAAQNAIVLGNNISNADVGLAIADLLGATGEYRDNTVAGSYTVAYSGGRNIGNNRAL